MPGTSLNVSERATAMINRLQIIERAHGYTATGGGYDGRIKQMKGNGGKIHTMSQRCRGLFHNIAAAKWVIPVGGELMRELEVCEHEVAANLAVIKQKK